MSDDTSKNETAKPTHTCRQNLKITYSRVLDPENNPEDRELIESVYGKMILPNVQPE